MSDEGLREIQLNGKQLVFMFMAVTVVAVVIFLCGVMVGRGVRAPRPSEAIEASSAATVDPTETVPRPGPAVSSPVPGAPPSSQETLTYPDRLEDPTPPPETLDDPAPEPPPVKAAKPPSPSPAPKPAAQEDLKTSE